MGRSDEGAHEDGQERPALTPRRIIADPRKFSEYVLDPDKAEGKDRIFVDLLGFRSRNEEDSRMLADIYVEQAETKIAAGDYMPGREDDHGRRYIVSVDLMDVRLRSVWILRPDGTLSLVTPFSGFVRAGRSRA